MGIDATGSSVRVTRLGLSLSTWDRCDGRPHCQPSTPPMRGWRPAITSTSPAVLHHVIGSNTHSITDLTLTTWSGQNHLTRDGSGVVTRPSFTHSSRFRARLIFASDSWRARSSWGYSECEKRWDPRKEHSIWERPADGGRSLTDFLPSIAFGGSVVASVSVCWLANVQPVRANL